MILEIEGMHCDACVRRVSQALARSGVGSVGDVRIGTAEVAAPEESAPLMLAALAKAGFAAHVQAQ